ncbi:MAG: lipopolysaccharide transport periplasmic protein LptA [Rhodobacteraceae bacterium]|nr:lipopolysaccharide transport periplasmic protein LptA [Paracoccaceae bacterium]
MTRMIRTLGLAALIGAGLALSAAGQGTTIAFGGLRADPTQPVEVTSDQLSASQTDATVVFSGSVHVVQGEMHLSADAVTVIYKAGDKKEIDRLNAKGHVLLVSGSDAAQADDAIYTIDTASVEMTGNVLLTQGASTISGQKLTVDLRSGAGIMAGRVKTVLSPGGN